MAGLEQSPAPADFRAVRRRGRPLAWLPMFAPLRTLSTALLFAAVAFAQQPGQAAPSFEFLATWNDAPKTFAELEGKVVIFDFARTW
jgi:hypothetical protein